MIYKHNRHKNTLRLVASLMLMATLFSCSKMDQYQAIVSTDQTKPDPVTDVKVNNINGGALITYTLPKSQNLLYVVAEYNINDGKPMQAKASYYTDTLRVEGFADEKEYTVKLYAVSRAEIKSDPVEVKIKPLTPVFKLLRNTLTLDATYSGVTIKGTNVNKSLQNIVLLEYDNTAKSYKVVDQHYRADSTIKYSIRGYDTLEHKFGLYVSDKWGNVSDTLITSLKPLYDVLLNKSKMSPYRLSTDAALYTASGGFGPVEYLWDDNTGSGWHTAGNLAFPILVTFDMGVSAKLNHFVMWERYDDYSYAHNNPKTFTVWGTNETPQNVALPLTSNEGDVVSGWTNMGNYKYPDPPSGNKPPNITASDNQFVKDGVDFDVPPGPKVRYLRIAVGSTWGGTSDGHIMELNLYADPR
ncbi:DUF4959 domain-containing protein [Chitinophagaceae bacterium 26-R-25]|nr:DUF4959 domain-containing protein [Chitinophagaceae bacterium 26-R-25]